MTTIRRDTPDRDCCLTSHQQDTISTFLQQARRLSQTLRGMQRMGMDVPPALDVWGRRFWATEDTPVPLVWVYASLDFDEPSDGTGMAVRCEDPGSPSLRFTVTQNRRGAQDAGSITENAHQECRSLSGTEAASALRSTDVVGLQRAQHLVHEHWQSYLKGFFRAVLDFDRFERPHRIGTWGEDGTLYAINGNAPLTKAVIVQPKGEAISIGRDGLVELSTKRHASSRPERPGPLARKVAALREELKQGLEVRDLRPEIRDGDAPSMKGDSVTPEDTAPEST